MVKKSISSSQQEIFSSILEHAPIGMVMTDSEGKIVLVNLELERLFGYKRQELLGQTVEILIPETLRKKHVEHRELFTQNPSPRTMGVGRELSGRRKDGSQFPIEVGLNPVKTETGLLILAVITDVTARKELEKRTIASEHLAAIGRISSHVAHEVRNPLSSISLNLDLLRDEIAAIRSQTEKPNEAETLVAAIQKEVERLSELTNDYLKFSKLSKQRKEKTNLQELFAATFYLLEAEMKKKDIQMQFNKTDLILYLDPKQMQQVILNLTKNAIEAMPQGGKIEIDVNHEPDQETVLIRIRDCGIGMSEEVQKKLFDPFYTTKDKGTGLGLSLVQQIIAEHQGKIWFESERNKGTTFFIRLPDLREQELLTHGRR